MKKWHVLLLSIILLITPVTASAYTDTTSATQSAVVKALSDQNIIIGYPDNTFQPNIPITRAQVAAIITRSTTLTPIRSAATFKDLPTTHYFYNNVQQLYRAGIVDGSDNYFYPDKPITRGELAKILTLTFNLTESTTTAFSDVFEGHWTTPYIGALTNANITRGYEDGTFKPHNNVTRGEFAYFIYRALYGAEPTIDATNIHDLTRYAPTYLSYISYEVFDLDGEGSRSVSSDYIEQSDTAFLDRNGLLSFNFRKVQFLYGINSSDFIFGKVYAPLRASATVQGTYDIGFYEPEYVTFSTTLTYVNNFRIKAGLFQNVSKVTVKRSDQNTIETFYFKEGYGLLKHEYQNEYTYYQMKPIFELLHFKLKEQKR